MLYTNADKDRLPTLSRLVPMLGEMVSHFPVMHRGPFTPIVGEESTFVLTRTSMRYSIKPNITRQGTLFGWMTDFDLEHPKELRGSVFDALQPDYLLYNVIKEDVELLFESHPLYALLQKGIALPNLRQPIRVENPYGLAHSYGLKSHFISLTSSPDIAAFHAGHRYDPASGTYMPITDPTKTGLFFVFELYAPFSMIAGLSTIGKQAFARPGANKLFAFQTGPNSNFCALPYVKGFQFRQDAESTEHFSQMFEGGQAIYPKEVVAERIAWRLREKRFSERAFRRNLENNPGDNRATNLQRLRAAGYLMDRNFSCAFSINEIKKIWFEHADRLWTEFWQDVYTEHLLSAEQRKRLMDLPNNEAYHMYFDANKWENSRT